VSTIVEALAGRSRVIAAELRPSRAELGSAAGIDAWIDTYHAVRSLTRQRTYVFLTDSAVGSQEEDNLRHLVTNIGTDAPRSHVVPFLTSKHTREYCLAYADRAVQHGFDGLVVLGGDQRVGAPRCVPHAWELRQMIRQRQPSLKLGGWANPHAAPAEQVAYLLEPHNTAEFFLTQVVSHHDAPRVAAFLEEADRRGVALPGLFGVFFYRSANPRTLALLRDFLPVPAEGLTREFEAGDSAEDICARTLRRLAEIGARHFYISNLPLARARATLADILGRADLPA
jgi:hypothetical protein